MTFNNIEFSYPSRPDVKVYDCILLQTQAFSRLRSHFWAGCTSVYRIIQIPTICMVRSHVSWLLSLWYTILHLLEGLRLLTMMHLPVKFAIALFHSLVSNPNFIVIKQEKCEAASWFTWASSNSNVYESTKNYLDILAVKSSDEISSVRCRHILRFYILWSANSILSLMLFCFSDFEQFQPDYR